MSSTCCLFNVYEESYERLFFHCLFAKSLWHWLLRKIGIHSNSNNLTYWFHICKVNGSNQSDLVVKVAFIFIVSQIWDAMNSLKHDNLRPKKRNAIRIIQNKTMLSENCASNLSSISITIFALIKSFGVQICLPRAPNIIKFCGRPITWGGLKVIVTMRVF